MECWSGEAITLGRGVASLAIHLQTHLGADTTSTRPVMLSTLVCSTKLGLDSYWAAPGVHHALCAEQGFVRHACKLAGPTAETRTPVTPEGRQRARCGVMRVATTLEGSHQSGSNLTGSSEPHALLSWATTEHTCSMWVWASGHGQGLWY